MYSEIYDDEMILENIVMKFRRNIL